MGGSKSKTYTDIQANRIFNYDTNLFQKDMVRTYALTRNIKNTFLSMLDSSMKYYRFEQFEKLNGVASIEALATVDGVNKYSIEVMSGKSNIAVYGHLSRKITLEESIKYWFEEHYGKNNSVSIEIEIQEHIPIINEILYAAFSTGKTNIHVEKKEEIRSCGRRCQEHVEYYRCYDDNGWSEEIYDIPNTVEKIKKIELNLYIDGTTGYEVVVPIDKNQDGVLVRRYSYSDGIWKSDGTTTRIQIPEDNRTIESFLFAYREDGGNVYDSRGKFWTTTLWTACEENCTRIFFHGCEIGYFSALKNELLREAKNEKVMLIPIKHGGSFVETKDILFRIFGMSRKDIQDDLDNSKLKEVFIGYTLAMNYQKDSEIRHIMKSMYKNKTVTINSNEYNIKYTNRGNATTVEISGISKTFSEDSAVYMVPKKAFKARPLAMRYELLKDALSIVAGSKVTVKLKWYQTGFFRIIISIAAVAFAFVTDGATMAVITAISIAASYAIKGTIGKVVSFAIGLLTLNPSATESYSLNAITQQVIQYLKMHWFDILIKTSTEMASYVMKNVVEDIAEKTERLYEETEKLKEQIEKIKRKAIYIPLDMIDEYYNFLYNQQYDMLSKCEVRYEY